MAKITKEQAENIVSAYESLKVIRDMSEIDANTKVFRVSITDKIDCHIHLAVDGNTEKIRAIIEWNEGWHTFARTKIPEIDEITLKFGRLQMRHDWDIVFQFDVDDE